MKKTLLIIAALTVSFVLSSSDFKGEPMEEHPSFVMVQAAEAFERYQAWKGDDETVVFPILTDLHSHDIYTYQHIGYIAGTTTLFHYDFMLNLGDIGLNIGPSHTSKEHANKVKRLTRSEMDKFPGVTLYAAGNHDWDAGEGEFHTSQELSDLFQKPALKYAGENLHLTPGKVYYYYDIPEKNFRVIILNSEGTETQHDKYYVFDDEQVEWFKALLDETPSDMNILLACHYMPHPNGRWHNTPADYTLESNQNMMALLSDYKTRRNIIGLFCGDSHFNMHEVENGVNYFITESYGVCYDEDLMPGTKHVLFDYHETLCCDIIAVKPSKHLVHTFRMGAGGSDFDYEFSY